MRNHSMSCLYVFLICFGTFVSGQDDSIEKRITSLESRLNKMDKRLARIENVLFATIRYTEAGARRQLDVAKEVLAQSEKLHAQGLMTAAELTLDRMSLERAATLHKMCIQNEDHRRIGATLNVLDAKQSLERKQLELDRAEQLYRKGFASKTRVIQNRNDVLLAGQKLKVAQTKLKEIESAVPAKTAKPAKEKSGDKNTPGTKTRK